MKFYNSLSLLTAAIALALVVGCTAGTESSEPQVTDKGICTLALPTRLSSQGEVPRWDEQTSNRDYVNNAMRRGLTPESCAKLLGWTKQY